MDLEQEIENPELVPGLMDEEDHGEKWQGTMHNTPGCKCGSRNDE